MDEKYFPVIRFKGVAFRDITPVLRDELLFECCVDELNFVSSKKYDVVAGIESRGFIFGSALAYKNHKGFVPIRKKGKLPRKTICETYSLEYGADTIEVHKSDVKGKRVIIVDDVLATGGTMAAACRLIEKAGGIVVACVVVIEIDALKGRDKLENVFSGVRV
jgi:adenine phosphoribosyltransferase